MENSVIGFLGFGEVATAFARGLTLLGYRVLAYDHNIRSDSPRGLAKVEKAQRYGVLLTDSFAEVVQEANIVISTVTPDTSKDVASSALDLLTSEQLYVDLNSSSPAVKEQIGNDFAEQKLDYIDGTIMGSPIETGLKTPILASGSSEKLGALLGVFNINWIGHRVGRAAAVKMCQSIVTKGMQSLLWETILLARSWQVEELAAASLTRIFEGRSFAWWLHYSLSTSAIHAGRRTAEMSMVTETLENANIPAHLASATRDKLAWLAGIGLKEHYQGERPEDIDELVDLVMAYINNGLET